MGYKLPELPFAYDALANHFDTETMTIHHQRHHQAYVNNLNKSVEDNGLEAETLESLLKNISKHSPAVRNNGGGHYNHSLFWETLSPTPKTAPEGKLAEEINKVFGSLEQLKAQINQAGMQQFGSGWAWLFVKYNGALGVSGTANQDNPLMDTNITNQGYPILGVDVWEHAYYLKYQNKRADYLDAFWAVLDWAAVEKKYEEVLSKLK
ncbi:superoxide dismutase [Limibacter armeniacum]|uniref:superoxide dismutase n=1 Tax=Limibacter armeniacum TaxID=466084 RepID=UPI002FE646F0